MSGTAAQIPIRLASPIVGSHRRNALPIGSALPAGSALLVWSSDERTPASTNRTKIATTSHTHCTVAPTASQAMTKPGAAAPTTAVCLLPIARGNT